MQRTVDRCTKLIDRHMRKLDAQKITIPNLTAASLWKESGRFDGYKSELFLTTDRQQRTFTLGPVIAGVIHVFLREILILDHISDIRRGRHGFDCIVRSDSASTVAIALVPNR